MRYFDSKINDLCIDLTEEIKCKIEQYYDKRIFTIEEIRLGSRSVYKWRITFSDKCSCMVFLRFAKDRLKMKHHIRGLEYLYDCHDLNVPRIIHIDSSCDFMICSACFGKKISFDLTNLNNNLIEMLVQLHTITERNKLSLPSVDLIILRYISEYQSVTMWHEVNEALNRNIVQNCQYFSISPLLKRTEELLDKLNKKISLYTKKFSFNVNYPFIHGDLHCGNILIDNITYSILDMEYWHVSPFVQNDLVKLLSWPSDKITSEIKINFIAKYYKAFSMKYKSEYSLDTFIHIFWIIDSYNRMAHFLVNEKKSEAHLSAMLDDINILID